MTGANGLVGSVLARDFAHQYDFTNLDLSGSPRVDITNAAQLDEILAKHPAEWLVHFAAFTDVTAAWEQTGDTTGLAYKVNVVGTKNLVAACEKYHKKLIHLSTAYVFSGDATRPYRENDATGPIEWYGQTKLMAEEAVINSSIQSVILRIDNPFRRDAFPKLDVVHRILERLADNAVPPQFVDAFFGPTVIEDLAKVIDWCIRTNATGLYHATANEAWTPHQFARAVAIRTGKDPEIVKKGLLTEYLERANRPYPRNSSLDCQKLIAALDFPLTSVQKAIDQVIIS